MTIQEAQDQIIEDFTMLEEEGMDKYEYLLDLAKSLPLIDDQYKTDEYLIEGCQSKVWLFAEQKDGLIYYTADSNTQLTKGIISMLVTILSERPAHEIMNAELSFLDKIGLGSFLSPQRANGLLAMLKQMRLYAIAYNARNSK